MSGITLWGLAPVMVLELLSASQPLLRQQAAASILPAHISKNAFVAFFP
jgi:hypothetical protein